MLTSAFKIAYQGKTTLTKYFSICAKNIAFMVCPDEQQNHLRDCYQDSQRIAEKVIELSKSTPEEIRFLLDFSDTPPDGFQNYSALTSFWTATHENFNLGRNERAEFPKVFPVLWAAKSFSAGFKRLSQPTQFFLNMSLAQSKTLLINVLEYASAESRVPTL